VGKANVVRVTRARRETFRGFSVEVLMRYRCMADPFVKLLRYHSDVEMAKREIAEARR
jgi:hypothetical protein